MYNQKYILLLIFFIFSRSLDSSPYQLVVVDINSISSSAMINFPSSPLPKYNIQSQQSVPYTSVSSSSRCSSVVTGLSAFTQYQVIVKAVNAEGPGPASSPRDVITKEDGMI